MSTRLKKLSDAARMLEQRIANMMWDETKHARGKTTPGSRGGSFAPKGGGVGEEGWSPATAKGHEEILVDIVSSGEGIGSWHTKEMRDHVKHIPPKLLPEVRRRIGNFIKEMQGRSREDGAFTPSEVAKIKSIYGIK